MLIDVAVMSLVASATSSTYQRISKDTCTETQKIFNEEGNFKANSSLNKQANEENYLIQSTHNFGKHAGEKLPHAIRNPSCRVKKTNTSFTYKRHLHEITNIINFVPLNRRFPTLKQKFVDKLSFCVWEL